MRNKPSNRQERVTQAAPAENRCHTQDHHDREPGPSVHSDLESLRGLAPNWDGYAAPAIDPNIIDAAERFVKNLADNLAQRPRVVPTSNGSIQLEWHQGPRSLELEFESPLLIRYLRWDPRARIEEEDTFCASDLATAAGLIRWLALEASQ